MGAYAGELLSSMGHGEVQNKHIVQKEHDDYRNKMKDADQSQKMQNDLFYKKK